MFPAISRSLFLPLMMRRSWPPVRKTWAELEKTQWWSRDELEKLQLQRVQELFAIAESRSPWWRQRFQECSLRASDLRALEDLQRFPTLEKSELRQNPDKILCEGASGITASATGGTTGEPTRYFWDDAYWTHSSATSLRASKLAGFEPGDRHVMIWGTAFHQSFRARFLEKLRESLRNLLVVPGFELSEANLPKWARMAASKNPKLVEGYTSLLMLFGSYLLREGITNLRPQAVISSAEKLHGFQRELIEKAFGAPVFDRYGSREVGCIAAECDQHQGLHINSEHVLVEILKGDERCAPGESGDIVITSLHNRVFPFLRYRIGDVGALGEEPCPCGRGLPLLHITEGRTHDLLTTDRGSYLPGEFFPHLFKEYLGVVMFQVHQIEDKSVDVRIVRNEQWDEAQEKSYQSEVAHALGDSTPVRYEYVQEIPRTRAGKLRFTISDVPVDLLKGAIEKPS